MQQGLIIEYVTYIFFSSEWRSLKSTASIKLIIFD